MQGKIIFTSQSTLHVTDQIIKLSSSAPLNFPHSKRPMEFYAPNTKPWIFFAWKCGIFFSFETPIGKSRTPKKKNMRGHQ